MSRKRLEVSWYRDPRPEAVGEPGIVHSFPASLATCLNHIDGEVDPVRLMGATGFAFRIWSHEMMCPSAMSDFDWEEILPEAVRQTGCECFHVFRSRAEREWTEARRVQGHEAIIESIEEGRPAIVWHVIGPEWGLVVGYDTADESYMVMSADRRRGTLPFESLGAVGVDILGVIVPHGANGRDESEIIDNSLRAVLRHADQQERLDRPTYQDGLPAYDQWATVIDRWATLARAGNGQQLPTGLPDHARYYATNYYAARRYARSFLRRLSGYDRKLSLAADAYAAVAANLRAVWRRTPKERDASPRLLAEIAADIRQAEIDEENGIRLIRRFVEQ